MAAQESAQTVRTVFRVEARKRRMLFWEVDEITGKPVIVSINPDGMDDVEYLAKVHEAADTLEEADICYFIAADEGPVKIGYAKDVKKRLAALQAASPLILKVLATASGGLTREAAYHYQFASYRLHGEWFERSPSLVAEISRLNA